MRIDPKTPIWVVTDPGPDSTFADVCFETTLDGLRLQFAGGLTMDDRPVAFTTENEAREEARNRLLVWRVASQIRLQRAVPELASPGGRATTRTLVCCSLSSSWGLAQPK